MAAARSIVDSIRFTPKCRSPPSVADRRATPAAAGASRRRLQFDHSTLRAHDPHVSPDDVPDARPKRDRRTLRVPGVSVDRPDTASQDQRKADALGPDEGRSGYAVPQQVWHERENQDESVHRGHECGVRRPVER